MFHIPYLYEKLGIGGMRKCRRAYTKEEHYNHHEEGLRCSKKIVFIICSILYQVSYSHALA